MSAQAPASTRRKKPEEVIGKGNVDRIAKVTMGYFLSQEFKKYELLEKPLPTRDGLKSEYYKRFLKSLREMYGAALYDTDPPLSEGTQSEETLRQKYVSHLPMAKLGTVQDYADLLETKYDEVALFLKGLAKMTDEEKALAVQKRRRKNIQQPAPPKRERRRRRFNPKQNR